MAASEQEHEEVLYHWQELLKFISKTLKEYDRRSDSESQSLFESLLDKLDHCICSLMRLLDCIPDDSDDIPLFHLDYLRERLHMILEKARRKHTECSHKLLALQSNCHSNYDFSVVQQQVSYKELTATGRWKIKIDIDSVAFLRSISMKWEEIARLFCISRSTLVRRCKEANYSDPYIDINDHNLIALVTDIKNKYPDAGERMIHAAIRSKGIRVTRERLRNVIHDVDPIGTSLRWNAKLSRKQYSVPGPNSLWHIDGNHKLVRWKIFIHAGIDGYSRLIVYMQCSNNNKATTVCNLFINATRSYFVPSRVRSDKGLENVKVAEFMLAYRGFDRGSMITGSSVHNQRIERLWRDMFRVAIFPFYQLFYSMEANHILDPLNNLHLYALHYTYIPRINEALYEFQKAWNIHGLSTEKGMPPIKLFTLGIAKLEAAGKISDDFYATVDAEYVTDVDAPVPILEDNIDVEPISLNIDLSQLQDIDVLRNSSSSGVDIYMEVLEAIESP